MSEAIKVLDTKTAVYGRLERVFEERGVSVLPYDTYEELAEELISEAHGGFPETLDWLKEKGLDRVLDKGTTKETYPHYAILSIFLPGK